MTPEMVRRAAVYLDDLEKLHAARKAIEEWYEGVGKDNSGNLNVLFPDLGSTVHTYVVKIGTADMLDAIRKRIELAEYKLVELGIDPPIYE